METLAKYRSGSNPNKMYEVIRGRDGVVYCQCKGWQNTKSCKHLLDFELTHGSNADELCITEDRITELYQTGVAKASNAPAGSDQAFQDAIQRASSLMKGQ